MDSLAVIDLDIKKAKAKKKDAVYIFSRYHESLCFNVERKVFY